MSKQESPEWLPTSPPEVTYIGNIRALAPADQRHTDHPFGRGNDSHSGDPDCRPYRLGARSPWTASLTYCDRSCAPAWWPWNDSWDERRHRSAAAARQVKG